VRAIHAESVSSHSFSDDDDKTRLECPPSPRKIYALTTYHVPTMCNIITAKHNIMHIYRYTDIIMILYAHIALYAIRVSYYIIYVIYTYTPTECETNDHVNRFRGDYEDGIDIVVLLLLLILSL